VGGRKKKKKVSPNFSKGRIESYGVLLTTKGEKIARRGGNLTKSTDREDPKKKPNFPQKNITRAGREGKTRRIPFVQRARVPSRKTKKRICSESLKKKGLRRKGKKSNRRKKKIINVKTPEKSKGNSREKKKTPHPE